MNCGISCRWILRKAWGGRSTLDAPRFISEIGLDAYEYEAGNGIASSRETLALLGAEAKKHNVKMTFHTPYFISLSGIEEEKRLKSIKYIDDSLKAAKLIGPLCHPLVRHRDRLPPLGVVGDRDIYAC